MSYADYRRPGELRAIIAGRLVPASDEALEALAFNAQLLSLGDADRARAISDSVRAAARG